MKKRKWALLILVLASALFCVVILYIWRARAVFIGTSTKTTDCYMLQFAEMNQSDSHVLQLEENNVLTVEYSIDKGSMDLTIGKDNENTIYKGNDFGEGQFKVVVPEDGAYKITVKARHASGMIEVQASKEKRE